jgi:hypothetical protein
MAGNAPQNATRSGSTIRLASDHHPLNVLVGGMRFAVNVDGCSRTARGEWLNEWLKIFMR